MRRGGFGCNDLRSVNIDISSNLKVLKDSGYSATDLLSCNAKHTDLFEVGYSFDDLGLEKSSVDDLIGKDFKPEDLQDIKSCEELFKSKKLRERYSMSHLKESLKNKKCKDLQFYISIDEYIDDPMSYSLEKLVIGKY